MAASRTTSRRSRRRSSRIADWLQLPILERRHLELIGLGMLALATFFGWVLYAGGDGGRVGGPAADGLGYVLGVARYLVPVALAGGGVVLLLGEMVPSARPFRAGALCMFAALSLSLSAGTLGLGPGAAPAAHSWERIWLQDRGGVFGEGLRWVAETLFSRVGAHILALFLLAAAALLLTGASVATLARILRDSAAHTARRVTHSTRELAAIARRPARAAVAPPEPVDEEPVVVRATHVEAPPPQPEAEDASAPEEPVPDADDPAGAQSGVTASGTPPDQATLTPQGRKRGVTEAEDIAWRIPDARILVRATAEQARPDTSGQERVSAQLVEALGHFGIEARVTGMVTGPHITRYELRLAPGIKVSKVTQLKDDLAYALAATEIRILAPIPGKQAVGVEVPNARRRIVHLGDVFQDPPEDWSPLTVWLGKDVAGRAIGADLTKMPHLLVAGTTGAGKSAAINAMLVSILLRATPNDVRLVLVDPKQVELNHYEGIPHLLTPVITSPRMAANALQNLVREMEGRYGLMSSARTRSLIELNRARERAGDAPLPHILCVIDELADLMMVAPADVEDSIIRLAQKARAVGIHLVLATQSPRVDVITGMIKANVPSRIAFAVSSQIDSRVILDQNGAESLLGQGDLLFAPVGSSRLQRIQGAYVDEPQIEKLTNAWRKQGEPDLHEELLEEVIDMDAERADGEDGFSPDEDPLLEEAIALVAQMGTASTSMLQRRLRLGYTRAGRLIDMLERRGVISGYEGSKPRQVLIAEGDVPRVLALLHDKGRAPSPDPVGADD